MASREQDNASGKAPDKSPDKAIDGLLRRTLARTAPSQDCPAPDILAAYCDRSLDAGETTRYELHFSACAHCRTQLAAMVRAGEPEAAEKQSNGWGWLAHRWWFVPAIATAAIALVISVRLVRNSYEPVPMQQVAMNAPSPAVPPSSEAARDSGTSTDTQLLDRAREKTAPPAASTRVPEKRKDLRLAVPSKGEFDAKSPSPRSLSKMQDAEGTPAAADSLTAQPEPASSAASRGVAPAPSAARSSGVRSSGAGSSRAGATSGFTAQNQVQQQNQRQNQQSNQPQSQQQNEISAQVQSQTVQVEAQEAPGEHEEQQASSSRSGAVGGAAAPAPRSDSKQVTRAAPLYSAEGKMVLKSDKAAVRNAKKSSILKIYSSPDDGAWWRLPDDGYVEFSPDAGETWHRKLLDANAELLTGAAPGGRIFWIVGREGVIYLTTDGTKWKKINPPDNIDFVAITARDARSASITASDRRVFTTEDGGKTWHIATP